MMHNLFTRGRLQKDGLCLSSRKGVKYKTVLTADLLMDSNPCEILLAINFLSAVVFRGRLHIRLLRFYLVAVVKNLWENVSANYLLPDYHKLYTFS